MVVAFFLLKLLFPYVNNSNYGDDNGGEFGVMADALMIWLENSFASNNTDDNITEKQGLSAAAAVVVGDNAKVKY